MPWRGRSAISWPGGTRYNKTARLFTRQTSVLYLIVALLIVLSISNTMIMGVLDRTGEIGTLMALGFRRARVLRLFVLEGGILGIVGGLLGTLLGVGAAQVISAIGIPMPPPPGSDSGFTAQILVDTPLVAKGIVLAVSTTLLASLYPAWRASRLVIVDALRHNR